MKLHRSILSKRYNTPKKYTGHGLIVPEEKYLIPHSHTKENTRRLIQMEKLNAHKNI